MRHGLEHRLVDKAPAPALAGFERSDNRMAGRVEMLGRVLIGRLVAAPDVTAREAKAEMDPAIAGLEAFLAP